MLLVKLLALSIQKLELAVSLTFTPMSDHGSSSKTMEMLNVY